jgi:hypothetical protein
VNRRQSVPKDGSLTATHGSNARLDALAGGP